MYYQRQFAVCETRRVPWSPTVLKGNLDAHATRNRGLDLYVIERPANSVQSFILLFAVDSSKRSIILLEHVQVERAQQRSW
jgi:hypothetical protein